VPALKFDLVYWANANYPGPLHPDSEPYIRTPRNQPIKTYRDGWLDQARAYVGDIPGDIIQKGKAWFGLDPVTEAVLKKKLTDLHKYYTEKDNRKKLRTSLKDALVAHRDKRIVLIAHSMGSIIAYDALRELGQTDISFRVEHLITIGSPLGLPTVAAEMSREWQFLRTPSVVKRWSNLSDRRDPVAFDTHLGDDYEANDEGVRVEDDLILNNYVAKDGKANYHKIYGYLRCPEMSERVRSIL
jgi:pimeloyl-ACP methyl ester carboxylesterase